MNATPSGLARALTRTFGTVTAWPAALAGRLAKTVRSTPWWRRTSAKIFQPRGPEAGEVFLNQRRVFILPTRSGFLFAGMLLALMLGSINYLLSLGFALTFLMAGVAWVGMFHTFRNLAHLKLRPARVDAVFAGEIAEFRVVLANARKYDRYALQLQADQELAPVIADPPPEGEVTVVVPVRTTARGLQPMPRITLDTTFPLGLWRAWSYWQPALSVLAYPTPAPADTPLPPARSDGGQGEGHSGPGSEDFAGIRPYSAGDVFKHLAWKAMARSPDGAPLTKIFDGGQFSELWLDFALLPGNLSTEAGLSRMTRWILDCEAGEIRYGLRLPGQQIDPDRGEAHRDRCLTALALYS